MNEMRLIEADAATEKKLFSPVRDGRDQAHNL
jgi:hypothetical protein